MFPILSFFRFFFNLKWLVSWPLKKTFSFFPRFFLSRSEKNSSRSFPPLLLIFFSFFLFLLLSFSLPPPPLLLVLLLSLMSSDTKSKSSSSEAVAKKIKESQQGKSGGRTKGAKGGGSKDKKNKRPINSFLRASARRYARVQGLGWVSHRFSQDLVANFTKAFFLAYIKQANTASSGRKSLHSFHAAEAAREVTKRNPNTIESDTYESWRIKELELKKTSDAERLTKIENTKAKKKAEGSKKSSSSSSSMAD